MIDGLSESLNVGENDADRPYCLRRFGVAVGLACCRAAFGSDEESSVNVAVISLCLVFVVLCASSASISCSRRASELTLLLLMSMRERLGLPSCARRLRLEESMLSLRRLVLREGLR